MSETAVLVFSGSARKDSLNGKLASLAEKELRGQGARVTRVSLRDYGLPLYDGDHEEAHGVPQGALDFRAALDAHPALFIACPEYNSGYSPLLKNSLDWASRGLSRPLLAGKLVALGSASPSWRGGLRVQIQARSLLELGYGATLIPESVMIAHADAAYDESGAFRDPAHAKQLHAAVARLLREARRI